MIKNVKIGTKITIVVAAAAIATVVVISLISNSFSKSSIANNYRQNLRILTDVREKKIHYYVEQIKANINFLAGSQPIKNALKQSEEPAPSAFTAMEVSMEGMESDTAAMGLGEELEMMESPEVVPDMSVITDLDSQIDITEFLKKVNQNLPTK